MSNFRRFASHCARCLERNIHRSLIIFSPVQGILRGLVAARGIPLASFSQRLLIGLIRGNAVSATLGCQGYSCPCPPCRRFPQFNFEICTIVSIPGVTRHLQRCLRGQCSIFSCHHRTAPLQTLEDTSDKLGWPRPRRFLQSVWRWLHIEGWCVDKSISHGMWADGKGRQDIDVECLNQRRRSSVSIVSRTGMEFV